MGKHKDTGGLGDLADLRDIAPEAERRPRGRGAPGRGRGCGGGPAAAAGRPAHRRARPRAGRGPAPALPAGPMAPAEAESAADDTAEAAAPCAADHEEEEEEEEEQEDVHSDADEGDTGEYFHEAELRHQVGNELRDVERTLARERQQQAHRAQAVADPDEADVVVGDGRPDGTAQGDAAADLELLPPAPLPPLPALQTSAASASSGGAASSSSGGAAASSSAASSSSAPTGTAAWESYDALIWRGQSKYPQVVHPDDPSVVIGEIQPLGGVWYQAVGVCRLHSGRCARMRAWKMAKGEHPRTVDRSLVRWLIAGLHGSGASGRDARMDCPRE